MVQLLVNDVIKDVHTEETFRILWIDRGATICYLIDINPENKKPTPFKQTITEIVDSLSNEEYAYADDLFLSNRLAGYQIDEKDLVLRNKAWDSIKDIVKIEPEIYEKKKRGKLIKAIAETGIASDNTILKNLRRFWQRGMVMNCLLPDYINCGNKGNYEYKQKTGRPREKGGGINITKDLQEIFKKSIEEHYFSRKKPSLAHAYKMMLRENFNKGYEFSKEGKNLKLKGKEDIPNYHQYYYWFKKIFEPETIIKKREGETAYERNHRGLTGATEDENFGPGSLYQIDSTPADIFLLNRLNTNWMVGKPTLYFVVDVFSRLITGFYVCLNAASWICMATALQNAFSNKKEYCSKLGINIKEEVWPVKGLPSAIVGDRGELESKFADALVEGLGVDIRNNPPYRPDWKGIVEQLFHSSHESVRPLLPGFLHKDSGKRGSKDFRHEATLTLDDYVKVIIHFINYYNHNHYMKDYIRNSDMIRDNVRPIPIELWNWGIKSSGGLRSFDKELVNFHLLPSDTATVTAEGIRYKTMLYSCDEAMKENWFAKARKKKWKVKFSYDPRNMSYIYIHSTEKPPYIPCTLLNHQEKYNNKTIDEINQLIKHEEEMNDSFEHEKLENNINLLDKVEEIAKKATKRKNEERDSSISKSNRLAQVKPVRNEEANERNTEDAIILDKANAQEGPENKIHHPENNEDYFGTPTYSIIDLFNKQREKKVNE